MAATVTAIYRYPVKGLSAEKMDRVTLTPGECLSHDRRFVIALLPLGVFACSLAARAFRPGRSRSGVQPVGPAAPADRDL